MLTSKEKAKMAFDLACFRDHYRSRSFGARLLRMPFNRAYILFGAKRYSPCKTFGQQLVLKIVDELLDTKRPRKENLI